MDGNHQKGDIQRAGRNQIDLYQAAPAYFRHVEAEGSDKKSARKELLTKQIRLTKVKTRKEKYELKEMGGRFLRVDLVSEIWSHQVHAFRQMVDKLPEPLAAELAGVQAPAEIQQIARRHCHDLLTRMAESDPPSG